MTNLMSAAVSQGNHLCQNISALIDISALIIQFNHSDQSYEVP
jgi:hypothetical protein